MTIRNRYDTSAGGLGNSQICRPAICRTYDSSSRLLLPVWEFEGSHAADPEVSMRGFRQNFSPSCRLCLCFSEVDLAGQLG